MGHRAPIKYQTASNRESPHQVYYFLLLSYRITHSEEIINLRSDERSHNPQVFLELSSVYRISEVFVLVGSKHHLLIGRQELPHPATHLPEERSGVSTAALDAD